MATEPIPTDVEGLAKATIDAAFRVHKSLGPGLLESAYEACLEFELRRREIVCMRQVVLPVRYETFEVEAGFRLDLLVDNKLIVEVKAVEALHPIHTAQLLTYLKLTKLRLGLLINFNVSLLKNGIRRVAS